MTWRDHIQRSTIPGEDDIRERVSEILDIEARGGFASRYARRRMSRRDKRKRSASGDDLFPVGRHGGPDKSKVGAVHGVSQEGTTRQTTVAQVNNQTWNTNPTLGPVTPGAPGGIGSSGHTKPPTGVSSHTTNYTDSYQRQPAYNQPGFFIPPGTSAGDILRHRMGVPVQGQRPRRGEPE